MDFDERTGIAGETWPLFATTQTTAEGLDTDSDTTAIFYGERPTIENTPSSVGDDAQQTISLEDGIISLETEKTDTSDIADMAAISHNHTQVAASQPPAIDTPAFLEIMMPQPTTQDAPEVMSKPSFSTRECKSADIDVDEKLVEPAHDGLGTSLAHDSASVFPAMPNGQDPTTPPLIPIATVPEPLPPPQPAFAETTESPSVSLDQRRSENAHLSNLSHSSSDIKFDYDEVEGHRILRLQPTRAQWEDFPAVLAYATSLNAEADGCFKVIIPDGLHGDLPEKPAEHVAANAYKVKLIRRTTFWQVSTVPSEGVFASSRSGPDSTESVESALKNLKHLFRKNQNKQLRNIRYRVDVPAWTPTQRRLAGVPEKSPIYPLTGDKLNRTKAIIPGIHTPYVYESGPYFGATFQIHAEDFRLASLNHLYKGRKIWIVVPATAVDVAEEALGRGSGCSQFMRHRAEFFFPDKLDKLGIPYRIVDQRPGETIVILPDAYHEGFSCGYTIAEAKNYADTAWTTDSYQPCQTSCQLVTAIPAAFMRPLAEGEERLDLCAAYGDGLSIPILDAGQVPVPSTLPLNQAPNPPANSDSDSTLKRGCDDFEGYYMPTADGKRIKV